jgi:hypothetical protein
MPADNRKTCFKDAVFDEKAFARNPRPRQREELIQLAAMCMRTILDTIDTIDKEGYSECQDDTPSGGCIL